MTDPTCDHVGKKAWQSTMALTRTQHADRPPDFHMKWLCRCGETVRYQLLTGTNHGPVEVVT